MLSPSRSTVTSIRDRAWRSALAMRLVSTRARRTRLPFTHASPQLWVRMTTRLWRSVSSSATSAHMSTVLRSLATSLSRRETSSRSVTMFSSRRVSESRS